MHAIVAGDDDEELGAALEREGVSVTRLEGLLTRPILEEAGVVDADLYVLTDVSQATTIPIVRDLTDVRTVVYARDSTPEFVKAQLDLAIDPRAVSPVIVAEELAGTAD